MTKIKNKFAVSKPRVEARVEAIKNIRNSIKTIAFVHVQLPSTTIITFVTFIYHDWVTNRLKEKNTKLKFFILENKSFQSHQSNQLSTKIRIYGHLFLHKKPMRPVIIQKFLYD